MSDVFGSLVFNDQVQQSRLPKAVYRALRATIQEGDVVICFNFRTDRGREITQALTQRDFPEHDMHKLDLHYVMMTNYDDSFLDVAAIFEKDNLNNTLGEVLSKAGRTQIRIAETEKYPHVTFFFNGGSDTVFKGEERVLVPLLPGVVVRRGRLHEVEPVLLRRDFRHRRLQRAHLALRALVLSRPDVLQRRHLCRLRRHGARGRPRDGRSAGMEFFTHSRCRLARHDRECRHGEHHRSTPGRHPRPHPPMVVAISFSPSRRSRR